MTFLPIVERELRIGARRPATYWLRSWAALSATVVTLFAFWGMNSHLSSAIMAKETFAILSVLAMVFCLFAGMFQTADCLSSEKRDGTLGLLFLTDLRGYDVVLGKLAANSLHSFYGLLSVLPILALPLLAGGVTAGEFWRVVAGLLAGLFFSLGVGMFVSAVTRETRQAIGLSAFLIILITGLLPAAYAVLSELFKFKMIVPLLWPSLGYALTMAADNYYNYRTGAREFWGSVVTIISMGIGSLILASFILPRAWQEKNQPAEISRGGSRWRRARFGPARRRELIRKLLAANPFHWLALRDRLSPIGFWLLAGVVAPFWLVFFYLIQINPGRVGARMGYFEFLIYFTFGLGLAFKCLVAAEASRRLNDDRKSGALELLLVTPLTEQKIVDGQRRALRNQFLAPILLLELLLAIVLWLIYGTRLTGLGDESLFMVVILGNMTVLLTDFAALGWVGMWTGLRARNHPRAILGTLLRILILPWLLYFILGVAGFFQGNSPVPFFLIWFGLGLVNDLLWIGLARKRLRGQFRLLATGAVVKARKLAYETTADYTKT
jgi:ABC-type transport system involved in cytochrome c biogenesis permease component